MQTSTSVLPLRLERHKYETYVFSPGRSEAGNSLLG